MGADIHLLNEKGEPVKYYRDPYNSYGLFYKLGLSWWQLTDTPPFILDDEGKLYPEAIAQLIPLIHEAYKRWEQGKGQTLNPHDKDFYRSDCKALLALLGQAIESGQPVHFSV
jgi:hypothetical protein